MEPNINDLIKTANLLYDQKNYRTALECYKQVLEPLLKLKSEQTGARQAQTIHVIENLLKKAEYCKNVMDNYAEAPVQRTTVNIRNTNILGQALIRPFTTISNSRCQMPNRIKSPPQNTQSNAYELQIESEIIERSPQISWESISGLTQAKDILQEAIIKPLLYPHIYTGLRSPPKGILLFGPPGTGKTLLAKAVASQCGATFLNMSSASLTSKNYGDAEKLVRAMFSVARKNQPSVIFIDEVDSILGSRGESQHEASRRLETEFLVQMDGVGSNSEDRVLLIAATNRPQELDEAVRRRLTKRIYIPLPDPETREILINTLLKDGGELSGKDIKNIVKATDGYSGSDLAALCKEAALDSVRGLSEKQLNSGKKFLIKKKNFENAIRVIRPSVPKSSLAFYEKWNEEFGVR
ncbi:hypothetical protein SteCoe_8443 [Stentor coeruleus]|uniref:microtubule-severing ATPase n=1 Tax=Stentor coeruleus TaxID=5963 RepID=A0A1R2CKA5_9CILI|nr:hypothetical protein SteCoe_8443 [Stentor coeruleus]